MQVGTPWLLGLLGDFCVFGRRRLGSGVKPVVAVSQMGVGHVRVDLGRRDVRMAKHLLNRTYVGPILDQVRGKRMAKSVR